MSKRHTDVRIIVVEIPYDNRNLYARLDLRATSVDVGSNLKRLRLGVNISLEIGVGDWLSA